jgi:hypothetical protein
LLVGVAPLFDLMFGIDTAYLRDAPNSAGHLKNVQQQVMRAKPVALLGDGLYGFKIAARDTSNPLYGGNQNGVVTQKTKADIEQWFAMMVFE